MGATIVMLHPLGSSGRVWRGPAGQLRGDHSVYTPDLPGHGANSTPFSMARAVDEIAMLLDGPGAPAYLVGSSLGAAVALETTLAMPSRVRGLFLTGATVLLPKFARLLQLAATLTLPPRTLGLLSARIVNPVSDADCHTMVSDVGRAGRVTHRRALRELAAQDLADRVGGVSVPTWVCCGDRDRISLPSARFLASSIPAGELKIIHGGGHLWHLQRPKLCADMVRECLAVTG